VVKGSVVLCLNCYFIVGLILFIMKEFNMKRTSVRGLLLIALISAFACGGIRASAQPYQAGHVSMVFTDDDRNGRQIPVEVYYPAEQGGEEVPVAPGEFPVLSLGHGFLMDVGSYSNFTDILIPPGYILVLVDTETGIAPGHEDFGLDLSFVLRAMRDEGLDPASLFFGSVSGRSGVMGHSMGGGASMLAAAGDTSITVVANFAAANTMPSAVSASANIQQPTLLFAGSEDCVTPPSMHQLLMYDSLASTCKTFISINGGGHCYFADYNFLCTLGENSCAPVLTVTREEQQEITFGFLLPWLDHFLKDDPAAWNIFTDSLYASGKISYLHDCSLTGLPEGESGGAEIRIYPLPFRDKLIIEGGESMHVLMIIDQTGREVASFSLPAGYSRHVSLGFLRPGIYHLLFLGADGNSSSFKGMKI